MAHLPLLLVALAVAAEDSFVAHPEFKIKTGSGNQEIQEISFFYKDILEVDGEETLDSRHVSSTKCSLFKGGAKLGDFERDGTDLLRFGLESNSCNEQKNLTIRCQLDTIVQDLRQRNIKSEEFETPEPAWHCDPAKFYAASIAAGIFAALLVAAVVAGTIYAARRLVERCRERSEEQRDTGMDRNPDYGNPEVEGGETEFVEKNVAYYGGEEGSAEVVDNNVAYGH